MRDPQNDLNQPRDSALYGYIQYSSEDILDQDAKNSSIDKREKEIKQEDNNLEPDAQPPIGITEAECQQLISDYMNTHFEQIPYYDLFENIGDMYSTYNGEDRCIYRYYSNDPFVTGTCYLDYVYYIKDADGEYDEEEAAFELLNLMLSDLKNENTAESSFVLLDYLICDQTLFSFDDLITYHSAMYREYALRCSDVSTSASFENYMSMVEAGGAESFYYALSESSWIFDPCIMLKYDGIANMYAQSEIEEMGLADEKGYVPEMQQGSSSMFLFLLTCRNNIWRMQRLSGLIAMYEERNSDIGCSIISRFE